MQHPISAGHVVVPDPATDPDLLALEMDDHPRGGFHGLLEVIPTKFVDRGPQRQRWEGDLR
jgi:hypothetical protein